MSKPIYNLFINRGMTDRFWRLSEDERKAARERLAAGAREAGHQFVIGCRSSWWNMNHIFWGVETFADFAAWRKYSDAREACEWPTYSRAFSVLGTWHPALDPAQAVKPEPGKIYQAFLVSGFTEAYYQLSKAGQDALWAKEAETRSDAGTIVLANTYWSSEEYQSFGVVMYPDIDALQRHAAQLEEIGWPRYVRAKTILGTSWDD